MDDAPLYLGPRMRAGLIWLFIIFSSAARAPLYGQERGTMTPQALPPLHITSATPAKEIFGRQTEPSADDAHVIGFYSKGCLAGAEALPLNGEAWQVMRLSRNRNWGHPALIAFIKRMARADRDEQIWSGFLVGDMAQPRGGPMITGHASHQIGLDADIWFTPMPAHRLTREERETMSATDLVRSDGRDINPSHFTPAHISLYRFTT
jgi:penicillin-insensitive murein DD-endopeptidase